MMAWEWMEMAAAMALSVTILSAGQSATHAPHIALNAAESSNSESWQDGFLRLLCVEAGVDSCYRPDSQ